MKIKGIGASNGIATAKVFELKETHVEITDAKIENIEAELSKVDNAIKVAVLEIEKVKEKAMKNLGAEEAAVFDAHIQVASDPAMVDEIKNIIKNERYNAIFATKQVTNNFAAMFESMDDDYMRERAADIKDVAKRIINALAGVKAADVTAISEEVIIVAYDLTPSETALLDKRFVKGFLTDIGGRTSHAAIMARSLEIPAVLGLKDITSKVENGDFIAMDGLTGEVLVNPSQEELKNFEAKAKAFAAEKAENAKYFGKPSITADDHHVELAANIGSPKDVVGANENDAEAVGLFRSEFLYMDAKDWPSEDDQYQAYAEVLKGMNGKKVVVRTLDIGGDKTLTYYKFPEEMNPFLGYRAIRLCLDQKDVFRTQLRALLRASVHGKLAIMFPMIATIDEFVEAKNFTLHMKKELISEGIEVAKDIEIGMMVEIPAAAIMARQFAKHADFFSIGTNDLMQYTMAADRMSEKVAYLYQPLNPSILNMINLTIQGAHAEGKWVGMCGEMAGDVNAIPLLVGMGLDEFSMSSTSILAARKQIAKMSYSKAKVLAAKALMAQTQSDVKELVDEFNKDIK